MLVHYIPIPYGKNTDTEHAAHVSPAPHPTLSHGSLTPTLVLPHEFRIPHAHRSSSPGYTRLRSISAPTRPLSSLLDSPVHLGSRVLPEAELYAPVARAENIPVSPNIINVSTSSFVVPLYLTYNQSNNKRQRDSSDQGLRHDLLRQRLYVPPGSYTVYNWREKWLTHRQTVPVLVPISRSHSAAPSLSHSSPAAVLSPQSPFPSQPSVPPQSSEVQSSTPQPLASTPAVSTSVQSLPVGAQKGASPLSVSIPSVQSSTRQPLTSTSLTPTTVQPSSVCAQKAPSPLSVLIPSVQPSTSQLRPNSRLPLEQGTSTIIQPSTLYVPAASLSPLDSTRIIAVSAKADVARKGDRMPAAKKADQNIVLSGLDLAATGSEDATVAVDRWVNNGNRTVPGLKVGTLQRITVLLAGFQKIGTWESWIPSFISESHSQSAANPSDLYIQDDFMSCVRRCHSGHVAMRVQSFLNMINEIQLAAKVAE